MAVAAIRGGFQEIWPSRLGSVGYTGVSSLPPSWHSAANQCAVESYYWMCLPDFGFLEAWIGVK